MDFCDGGCFEQPDFPQYTGMDCRFYIFYFNDIEVVDNLGSHKKVHKLGRL